VIQRGDIWWAILPAPSGSEPGYRRPVVIIQSDFFNRSGIMSVVVASISSNTRLAAFPGNVALSAEDSGLPRDSVINVTQILAIDKSFLTVRVGHVPWKHMQALERGLRLVLSL